MDDPDALSLTLHPPVEEYVRPTFTILPANCGGGAATSAPPSVVNRQPTTTDSWISHTPAGGEPRPWPGNMRYPAQLKLRQNPVCVMLGRASARDACSATEARALLMWPEASTPVA